MQHPVPRHSHKTGFVPVQLFWIGVALFFAFRGIAQVDPAKTFETANKLYEEHKFAEAAATYEAILEQHLASAPIYFNQGNACFKAGAIGKAIVAYRRAAQLTPRDPDLRANLQFARNQVPGPTIHPTRWQRAFGILTLNEWTGMAAAGIWLTFLTLAAAQLRPSLHPTLNRLALGFGSAALLLGVCVSAAAQLGSQRGLAVVVVHDAIAHQGPLDISPSAFTASDGAELRILDQKDDWLQVSDGVRRPGWLKRSQVIQL